VCDGAERSEFAKTLLMLGQAAGAVIFTPLADRYGRKPCNVIARILYFVTALATVFTPNIAAFSEISMHCLLSVVNLVTK
jgi:MFS family permease